jgi:hypothetical protein
VDAYRNYQQRLSLAKDSLMTTINDLAVTSSVSSDDKVPLWQNSNGVTRAMPISVLDSRYLTAEDVASLAASPTTERFISDTLPNPTGLPTFTAGSTTAITLQNEYFSAANIEVFFDTSYQGIEQYSLVGFGLAFIAPIPDGVQNIYVHGGSTRVVGTPGQGTVIDDMIAPGTLLYNRIHDFISIKDGSGVTGDGTVNETTAINTMLALSSGNVVYFPAGVYLMDVLTIPSNIKLIGEGKGRTIIRRSPNALASTFVDCSGHDIEIEGITFDGNKANNSSTCYGIVFDTGHYAVNIRRCRATNFNNGGFNFTGDTNAINNTTSSITECESDNNGGPGVNISKVSSVNVLFNYLHDNTADGIAVSNFVFPPVNFSQVGLRINGNNCRNNGGSGIAMLGFTIGGNASAPIYGPSLANSYINCDGNYVRGNKVHGIIIQCEGFTCNSNLAIGNGDPSSPIASAFAGIECSAHAGTVANNYVTGNSGYGIDLGAASSVSCHDNLIFSNAKGGGFIGLNVGAVTQSNIHDNIIYDNGSTANGVQIMLTGIDGDGNTPFESIGSLNEVHHNRIQVSGSQIGIHVQRQESTYVVKDNQFEGGNPMFWIVNRSQMPCRIHGNVGSGSYNGYSVASASPSLVVPDGLDEFVVTGNTSFSNVLTKSQNDYVGKVLDVAMSNNGTGYTSKPTVSFSGGGGSGAAATAELSNSGRIIGVNMTNNGSGYTSAPTVSFSGGGGSSAAGAAIVGCANSDGREITLQFTGTLTVSSGSNLNIRGGSYNVTPGSILKLRCNFGGIWYEVSRN